MGQSELEIDLDYLKTIIYDTVKVAIQDLAEDEKAILSSNYINSIEEARIDYQTGNYKELGDLLDV